jgi:hypothetical protein
MGLPVVSGASMDASVPEITHGASVKCAYFVNGCEGLCPGWAPARQIDWSHFDRFGSFFENYPFHSVQTARLSSVFSILF